MNSQTAIILRFPEDRCRLSARQERMAEFERLRHSLSRRRIAREIAEAMDWARWDAPDIADDGQG